METNSDIGENKPSDQFFLNDNTQQSLKQNSYPLIAGVLLIIAGVLGIIFWFQMYTIDTILFESIMDNINQMVGNENPFDEGQIIGLVRACLTIGIVISIFPILGGILAIKRKLFYIVIVGGIFGIFSIGVFYLSIILSIISLVLLIQSKDQFQI